MDKRKRRLLCMLEGSGKKSRWISGVPPLSYKAFAAGTLENYRIYGNTVGGESVGDLVESGEHAGEYSVPVTVEGKNLLPNADWVEGYITGAGGIAQPSPSNQEITSPFVKVIPGKTYVFSYYPNEGEPWRAVIYYTEDKRFIKRQSTAYSASSVAFTVESGVGYVRFSYRSYGDGTFSQLELGDTATDYEPYHAPITTPIYLPEQIRKVGDEAEYISYAEQKMHRIGADDIDVTLSALPTLPETNVLSVGTAVQPSNIEIKGKIKAL